MFRELLTTKDTKNLQTAGERGEASEAPCDCSGGFDNTALLKRN